MKIAIVMKERHAVSRRHHRPEGNLTLAVVLVLPALAEPCRIAAMVCIAATVCVIWSQAVALPQPPLGGCISTMRLLHSAIGATQEASMRSGIVSVAVALALAMATMTTSALARGGRSHPGWRGNSGGGWVFHNSSNGLRINDFHHGDPGSLSNRAPDRDGSRSTFFPLIFLGSFPWGASPESQVSAAYNAQQAPQGFIFNEYNGASNGPGGFAYGGYAGTAIVKVAQTCVDLAAAATQVPIDQIRETVHLMDEQQALLDDVGAASLRAKGIVQDACQMKPSPSLVGRVDAAEKQSEAIVQALQVIQPPLDKFYASLTEDQKAKLNNMGVNNMGVSAPPVPSRQTKNGSSGQANDNHLGLKVGTRVKLKSGGPLMTVEAIHDSEVTCMWFEDAQNAAYATFPAASLMQIAGF